MDQFIVAAFCALEYCDMSRNNIRRDPMLSLGYHLSDKNCKLKELRLDANEMTDCTTESIALGLLMNKSLEKISLNNNYISDAGAERIAIAIGLNPHKNLKEISLSGNKIHNVGAIAIMKHLGTNIVKLDLSVNRITDGRFICQMLRKDNTSIRKLSMSRNPIPAQYAHEIEFWTRLNASGGRQLLTKAGDNKRGGDSLAVWPTVLGKLSSDPNGLYYFLIRKPELCLSASKMQISRQRTAPLHFKGQLGHLFDTDI
jgi:hypothetical protein